MISMRSYPRWLGILGTALLLLAAVGCSSPAAPAPAPTAPPAAGAPAAPPKAPPATVRKVTFASGIQSPTIWPVWVGIQEGFFKKYGLELEEISVESSPMAMQTMVGGKVDIALSGGPDAIKAAAAGASIKVIATFNSATSDSLIAKSNIDTPAKLKGGKVAISQFGSLSHLTVWLMVKSIGLDPDKDVTYVQIGNDIARAAALQAGSVEAAPINPTTGARLEKELGLKALVRSGKEIDFPTTTLVIPTATFDKEREMLKGVVKGFLDGVVWLYDPANGTKARDILRKQLKMKPDDPGADVAYQQYITERLYPASPKPARGGFKQVQDFSAKFEEKIKDINLDQLIDTTVVDAAMAERK